MTITSAMFVLMNARFFIDGRFIMCALQKKRYVRPDEC
jgi:hypothetical protein